MSDLQRHKKSDKIKWVITAITLLLVSVMLAGVCLQVFAKDDKYKPSEWFKKTEQTEQLPDENNSEVTAKLRYNAALASASESGVSAQSDNFCGLGVYSTQYANNDGTLNTSDLQSGLNLSYKYYNYSGSIDGKVTIQSVWTSFVDKADVTYFYQSGATTYTPSTSTYSDTYINIVTDLYSVFDWTTAPSSGSNAYDTNIAVVVSVSNIKRLVGTNNSTSYEINRRTLSSLTFCGLDPTYIYTDSVVYIMTARQFNAKLAEYEDRSLTHYIYRLAVSLPADPVKDGYVFVGWYYDSAFSRPYDGKPIYEETKLYAKFEINKYTVTFDSNGGSSVDNQTVTWGASATLPTTTRDGYGFSGWFLPNGTRYTNQAIKENTTLTAKWYRNRFTVTFNSGGGSEVASQTVSLNGSATLTTPTRTGYTFKGWFLPNGTQYTNQAITDDTTLTAQWEIIMCTVTFYVDGEVYHTVEVEYGTQLARVASDENLSVLSVSCDSADFTVESLATKGITSDITVTAQEAQGVDKVVNTVKSNKWAIIGGVAGGVALIAMIAVLFGSIKRKKR